MNILSGGLRIHTKYQGSRPCGFNKEDFFMFSYLAYVKHVTPRGRPIFGPRGIRTSDSLNERLPIKNGQRSFKENYIFSTKKIVGSTLELSAKVFFSLDNYKLKKMV